MEKAPYYELVQTKMYFSLTSTNDFCFPPPFFRREMRAKKFHGNRCICFVTGAVEKWKNVLLMIFIQINWKNKKGTWLVSFVPQMSLFLTNPFKVFFFFFVLGFIYIMRTLLLVFRGLCVMYKINWPRKVSRHRLIFFFFFLLESHEGCSEGASRL